MRLFYPCSTPFLSTDNAGSFTEVDSAFARFRSVCEIGSRIPGQGPYGVSPLAYLRMRRLNSARRALNAAHGTDTTVAHIAMRWGFFHFARFSQDYFHQFGEFPSTTLGRSSRTKPEPGRYRQQR
ncbi:helix-turn-helix domain-containing protein [Pararobbsia alpina]|uniref:helix-turn-helix domain-containing protein n=1 Tax=Pararobbsia alpina TaxID=621374 RepID=UPI003CCDCB1C